MQIRKVKHLFYTADRGGGHGEVVAAVYGGTREEHKRMGGQDLHAALACLRDAQRQVLALESAYPGLRSISMLWDFLPAGHPDGLSREARYVLMMYRGAHTEAEIVRQWLLEIGAELWIAAVEAEARQQWQHELATLRAGGQRWAPLLPELMAPVTTLAVA
jgi:hypothetical protein